MVVRSLGSWSVVAQSEGAAVSAAISTRRL